jgi:hypothetical protein
MQPAWKPPIFDRIAVAMVIALPAVPVAALVALGLEPSPLFLAVVAVLVVMPIAEVVVLRRRMADIWHSQRLFVPLFEGDLAGAIEAALQGAGMSPTRVSLSRTPLAPEREVLLLGGGLNVTVISAPRGQVVYAGPDRDATRGGVERAKAAVDAALAAADATGQGAPAAARAGAGPPPRAGNL